MTCVFACFSLVFMGQSRAAGLDEILKSGHVPGASYAVIREGKLSGLGTLGVRDASTGAPVTENTVFEAASLSKPVFAYYVLQLIDAGILSLDTPLSHYAPDGIKGDARAQLVTVRDVLNHSSGLPNVGGWLTPVKTYFPPGQRFSYSGEAFLWLQHAVVAATGESLDSSMARLVFEPLGMTRSSYVWRADFEADHATPHQGLGPRKKARPTTPMVSYSLHTTAADYARFLQAVLSGARLKRATAKQWLQPQIKLFQHCIECLDAHQIQNNQHVAWGLGWGLEPVQGTFFHWGDNGTFKAFVVGSIANRSAVVVFTNSSNGMAVMPDMIDHLMPGEHPAFAWLNYDRSTPTGGWLDWVQKP